MSDVRCGVVVGSGGVRIIQKAMLCDAATLRIIQKAMLCDAATLRIIQKAMLCDAMRCYAMLCYAATSCLPACSSTPLCYIDCPPQVLHNTVSQRRTAHCHSSTPLYCIGTAS